MTSIDFLTAETACVQNVIAWHCRSSRKCRLFAVVSCRFVIDHITYRPCQYLIDLAENFADARGVSAYALRQARRCVYSWGNSPKRVGDLWESKWAAYHAAVPTIIPPVFGFLNTKTYRPYLADIFGNPFRPVAFDPAWQISPTTRAIRPVCMPLPGSPITGCSTW
ncbi:MAG: hypothetical protein JWO38_8159 [Gemmataceae bacterium]|nr:hypothetical protein [Gemmataceae bacterium]